MRSLAARVAVLFACSLLPTWAATITFQGSVITSTGMFEMGSPVGQSVSGIVTFNASGLDLDPSPNVGLYLLTDGTIELFFDGMASSPIQASVDPVYVNIEDAAEGSDRLQFLATISDFFSLRLDFLGTESFLNSTNLPLSPSDLNWSAFTGGYGQLALIETAASPIMPVAGPATDQLEFEITSVNDVPEPATWLMASIGLVLIAARKRRA